jgi:hypothetical protein
MKKTTVALVLASSLLGGAVMAEPASNGVYGNVGITQRHTNTTDTLSLTGRLGTNLTTNFGLEAEGGIGIDGDRVLGVKIRDTSNLGAYAVGRLPVSDNLSLLGRVGYHHTWAEAKALGVTATSDDGSAAVGIGAEFMFSDSNGIRADYTRFTEDKGVDNFGVSYVHKF